MKHKLNRTNSMRNNIYFLLIAILSICYELKAEDIIVTPKLSNDTNNVLIGDRINLLLEFESNKKINLVMPAIPDSIGAIEILRKFPVDTTSADNKYRFTQRLVVTCFDSGAYVIPPFVFMYEKPGFNTLFPASTDSIFLYFHTVEVDTSQAIKDIKGPLDEPITFEEYVGYILVALGIILISFAVWYFWRKHKLRPTKPKFHYDPKIPADIFAKTELEKLEKEKLWQAGFVKQYYSRLTDILRLYIQRQLNFQALEMTTDEILNTIKNERIAHNNIAILEFILRVADLVKFAKSIPLPDENGRCMSDAYQIVENIANELKIQHQ